MIIINIFFSTKKSFCAARKYRSHWLKNAKVFVIKKHTYTHTQEDSSHGLP